MHQQLVFLLQHLLDVLAEKRLLILSEILDLCESLLELLLFMIVYARTIFCVIVNEAELVLIRRKLKGSLKMQFICVPDLTFVHI